MCVCVRECTRVCLCISLSLFIVSHIYIYTHFKLWNFPISIGTVPGYNISSFFCVFKKYNVNVKEKHRCEMKTRVPCVVQNRVSQSTVSVMKHSINDVSSVVGNGKEK